MINRPEIRLTRHFVKERHMVLENFGGDQAHPRFFLLRIFLLTDYHVDFLIDLVSFRCEISVRRFEVSVEVQQSCLGVLVDFSEAAWFSLRSPLFGRVERADLLLELV